MSLELLLQPQPSNLRKNPSPHSMQRSSGDLLGEERACEQRRA
eukprot:s361_g14.t1